MDVIESGDIIESTVSVRQGLMSHGCHRVRGYHRVQGVCELCLYAQGICETGAYLNLGVCEQECH
jgi:hypothetical protein